MPLALLRLARVATRHRRRTLRRRRRPRRPPGCSARCSACTRRRRAGRVDRHLDVRLRAGEPDPRRAARPARVRPGRAGRPARAYAAEPAAHRPARQGRAVRVRRELRPGGGRRARRSRPASTGSSTTAPAGSTRPGFGSRSAFLTSPTFGGDQLAGALDAAVRAVGRQPAALRRAGDQPPAHAEPGRSAGPAGARSATCRPNTHDWPQGRVLPLRPALRLPQRRLPRARGSATRRCPTSTPSTPFHRLELARPHRRPVMAEIDLISSHAPVVAGPRTWSTRPRSGDGSVVRRDARAGALQDGDLALARPGARGVRAVRSSTPCRRSCRPCEHYGDDNTVLVVLGDHQPAPVVSGTGADHDVPVTVVAKDPAVLRRIDVLGLAARPAPVARRRRCGGWTRSATGSCPRSDREPPH